jgi:hypothetical protein
MTRAAFLLLLPLLAACDIHANRQHRDDDSVSIRSDASGNVSFDLPFAKGQVKLPEGFMHDGDVDIDGVKLMPGSKMTGFNLDSHNDVSNVELAFTSPAPPEQVRAYYVDQFKQKGVEASVSGDTVVGKSKDGKPFRIEIGPAAGGSQGKLVVEDHDKH